MIKQWILGLGRRRRRPRAQDNRRREIQASQARRCEIALQNDQARPRNVKQAKSKSTKIIESVAQAWSIWRAECESSLLSMMLTIFLELELRADWAQQRPFLQKYYCRSEIFRKNTAGKTPGRLKLFLYNYSVQTLLAKRHS